jgi:anaerobic magnesium-protoporphyrin IX monomethyl ester cyclase
MIALLNPTSARWKHRFPLSLMFLGAVLENKYPYTIIDQNLNPNALSTIEGMIRGEGLKYLCVTVMPGPQLYEAIPLSKYLKEKYPDLTIIWGGYFASLHAATVLQSGYVDYVIRGQGEYTLLQLIDILEGNSTAKRDEVAGLAYRANGGIRRNPPVSPSDPNQLPPLPYHRVEGHRYIGTSWLGRRTGAYYSSVGCPFLCGFCAVASIYRARWLARTPDSMVADLDELRARYGIDAVEFFDENFFTAEKRAYEFARKVADRNISWWGEGRPDTVLEYTDDTLRTLRRGGLKMIFFGAESASEEMLQQMNKGGTQTPDTVLRLAERLKAFDIVPEFSLVFGAPGGDIDRDFDRNIRFIRLLKRINPRAEIIMYMYAPVMFEESDLSHIARSHGFSFPESLEDWLKPEWQNFDLRKTPVIPWLKPKHYRRFKNFERVLHGKFPTLTDLRLTENRRKVMQFLSSWRYRFSVYDLPLEIRVLQRLFRYRQPEIEGL